MIAEKKSGEQELSQMSEGAVYCSDADGSCPYCHKLGAVIRTNYQLYINDKPWKKVPLRKCMSCGTKYYMNPYPRFY